MSLVLVGTDAGCSVFCDGAKAELELPGRSVGPMALEAQGSCVAIVNQREIWRRSAAGDWLQLAAADVPLQSLMPVGERLLLGGSEEAILLSMTPAGEIVRVASFDNVPGRGEWFAGGPPLGVRSLAAACDKNTILAAVHVGGVPRSRDGGETWSPTMPVLFDVHEVRFHPSLLHVAAAAAAVGLCVSSDGGEHWDVLAEGQGGIKNSLAVTVLEEEVLFSVQDGPFAARSQLWRWPVNGGPVEQVRQGLPEWLEGKVDAAQLVSGGGQAAVCDSGGNLWLSEERSLGWAPIAQGVGYASGLLIV